MTFSQHLFTYHPLAVFVLAVLLVTALSALTTAIRKLLPKGNRKLDISKL